MTDQTLSARTLTIDRLSHTGEGIAGSGAEKTFVPYTLPGEQVTIRNVTPRDGAFRAELDSILTPSPQRITPACVHFTRCGGCVLQHASSELQASFKRDRIITALHRVGLTPPVAATVQAGAASRRRTTLSFQRAKQGNIVLGYHARARHDLIAIRECPVLESALQALLPHLASLLDTIIPAPKQGLTRGDVSLTLLDDGIDLILATEKPLGLNARLDLADFAEKHQLARLSWQSWHLKPALNPALEPISHRHSGILRFGDQSVTIPVGGFLQASRAIESALQLRVQQELANHHNIADLFAGSGTFGLSLIQQARKISLFESDSAACNAARHATASVPKGQITITRRDLFRAPLSAKECDSFDGIVLDPPRAGAREQCLELAETLALQKIIYISCDPDSFARDAAILARGGWHVANLTPYDQFTWSSHIELLAVFTR